MLDNVLMKLLFFVGDNPCVPPNLSKREEIVCLKSASHRNLGSIGEKEFRVNQGT